MWVFRIFIPQHINDLVPLSCDEHASCFTAQCLRQRMGVISAYLQASIYNNTSLVSEYCKFL